METKKSVDYLKHFLDKANYNVISIHGDKTQIKRQEAINSFSKGDVPILIATDVASRGLDFPNVAYVFNYDLPKNIDDYVHRIGRTGRCGNKGNAVSFVNEDSMPIVKDLYHLLKKLQQEIPQWFEDMYRNNSTYSYTKNYNKNNNKFNNYSNSNQNYENSNNKFNNNYNSNGYKPNYNNNDNNSYNYNSYNNNNSNNNFGNNYGENSQSKFKKFNVSNYPKTSEVVFRKGEKCPNVGEGTTNYDNGYKGNNYNNQSNYKSYNNFN